MDAYTLRVITLRQNHNAIIAPRVITLRIWLTELALRVIILRQKHNAVAVLRFVDMGKQAGLSNLLWYYSSAAAQCSSCSTNYFFPHESLQSLLYESWKPTALALRVIIL